MPHVAASILGVLRLRAINHALVRNLSRAPLNMTSMKERREQMKFLPNQQPRQGRNSLAQVREPWVSVFRMASAVGAAQKPLFALCLAARGPAVHGRIHFALYGTTAQPSFPRVAGSLRAKRSSRALIRVEEWIRYEGHLDLVSYKKRGTRPSQSQVGAEKT